MAHFARIENGIVSQVIVISNDSINNLNFPESEPIGQAFIASIGLEGEWRQTSYNNNFRNFYAGLGDVFDPDANNGEGAFYSPVMPQPIEPIV